MLDLLHQVAFVGSYSSPEDPGIHVLSFDGAGTLEQKGSTGGVANPSFLKVHPDGHHLYAVSETGRAADGVEGAVVALQIERSADRVDLTEVSRRSTLGDQPCHISIDATARWLFATNYGSGDVAIFRIEGDGTLGECTTRIQHVGRGADPGRQSSPHPHSSVLSPGGEFLLVADLGIDQVIVYAWDGENGVLSEHGVFRSSPGSGPRTAAFDPSGRFLCVVNELNSTVTVCEWNADTGSLNQVQSISTLPGGIDVPNLAADLEFSASGENVFVSNRGHDSIMSFAFDPARGLTAIGTRTSGGRWPRSLALDPADRELLVANEHSHEVVPLPLHRAVPDTRSENGAISIQSPSAVVVA